MKKPKFDIEFETDYAASTMIFCIFMSVWLCVGETDILDAIKFWLMK